jgi:Phage integrase, N-terminal SAM-like domain
VKCVVDWLSSVSVTIPGLRVQPVVMTFGDAESWTLVDRDAAVVEPVEAFLAHLHAVERSPNTIKAYAHDLRDWFEFLDQHGLGWSRVRLEDVGRFVAWLRLPATARAGNVAALPTAESVCSEATVNRKLSAISAFYEFHQRHGVDLGDLLTTWQRRATHGGSWRPLLAHLSGLKTVEFPAVDDRRGRVEVVEQRGVVGEAFLTHQLLVVQRAVGHAKLRVPLARYLAPALVVRHQLTCP